MNKNKKIAIFSLIVIVALGIIGFAVFNKSSHLSEDKRVLERVDYVSKNEATITESTKIIGTHIRNGGPYKVGETVLSYGMAIKVEKVGWREGLEEEVPTSLSNETTDIETTEEESTSVQSEEETIVSEEPTNEDSVTNTTKFAVFKLHIYNLNSLPYDFKPSDVTLIYNKEKSKRTEQPVTTEGYDNWKFIKGSYEFEPVGTSTYRSGYVYFPVTDEVVNGGFIRVMLQNIPIDFNY